MKGNRVEGLQKNQHIRVIACDTVESLDVTVDDKKHLLTPRNMIFSQRFHRVFRSYGTWQCFTG